MTNSSVWVAAAVVMGVSSASGEAAAQPADQPAVVTGDERTAAPPQPPSTRGNLPYGTGPSATSPIAPAGPSPADADAGVEPASLSDANAGNNFFMPTALMPAAGSFGFHDYELFVVGLSYAPSNSVVLSFSTLIPIEEGLAVGLATAKVQVYRGSGLRVALHGAALFGSVGEDGGQAASTIGVAATACFDDKCTSHFSGFGALGLLSGEGADAVPLLFAGGVVLRLSDNMRLLGELDIGAHDELEDNGKLLWYGLRFTSRHLSTDLGFVRLLSTDDSNEFPLGFPMLIFNYRS